MGRSTYGDLLALVVDDDARTRNVRKRQLEQRHWNVIVVGSKKEAVTQLNACPEVDAVLTDLRLDTTVNDDKSGVALARIVRQQFGQIPIMAYSAYVADRPLSADERQLFTHVVGKRIMKSPEVDKHLGALRDAAIEHRERRRSAAESQMTALNLLHDLETIDAAETVRRLMPHAKDSADIEESLRSAGYHLELVHSSAFRCLATPILVWIREVEDGVEAEVYGQPALYAHGENADDAVTKLVDLMRLFAEDFGSSDGEEAGPALRMRAFLERTIELGGEE
jgi:CheY-like chemotaxis protein